MVRHWFYIGSVSILVFVLLLSRVWPMGGMGLERLDEIRPHHIFRRIDDLRVRHFGELYDFLEPGQLIDNRNVPKGIRDEWNRCRPDRWTLQAEQGQYGGESARQEVYSGI
jgi:hypothetical protein